MATKTQPAYIEKFKDENVLQVWTDASPIDISAIPGVIRVHGPVESGAYLVTFDPRYAFIELTDEIRALK